MRLWFLLTFLILATQSVGIICIFTPTRGKIQNVIFLGNCCLITVIVITKKNLCMVLSRLQSSVSSLLRHIFPGSQPSTAVNVHYPGDGHYPWVHTAWAAKASWICALDSEVCLTSNPRHLSSVRQKPGGHASRFRLIWEKILSLELDQCIGGLGKAEQWLRRVCMRWQSPRKLCPKTQASVTSSK